MFVLLVISAIAISLASLLAWTLNRSYSFWSDRNIPHDTPYFFFGNLKGVGTKRHLADAFLDTYKKYKGEKFVGFYILFNPTIFLIDLDLIKAVLIKDFNNFTDRGLYYNERDDPLSAHLVNFDGARWKSLRQKLAPTFSSEKIKFMFSIIVGVADQFSEVLKGVVANEEIVEIRQLLARYSVDVIGTCAFGIDCNSLKNPNAEFLKIGRKSLIERRHGIIVELLMTAYPAVARFLRIKDTLDDVNEFFMHTVRETVEYRKSQNVQRNDFLDLLIGLKDNADPYNEAMTLNEIAAQAFVFFLGGFETSSTTLSYTLYQLALHQDIQDKVRKEINETIRKFNNELVYEGLLELNYMEQVISETLRHKPIIPHLIRKAVNDYKISGTNFVIEKGTQLIIPIDAIHRDPDIYPQPEKFEPDRFLPDEVSKRNPIAYLPFGLGPRNCIGERFAHMQMRIGLATLLRNFKFSVCNKTEIPLQMTLKGVIVAAKGGIYLKVENISL